MTRERDGSTETVLYVREKLRGLAPGIAESLLPFEPVRCLGRGGMGTVYEAAHQLTGERVALKVLHPEQPIERLKSEFRAIADLMHPNLVRLGELRVSQQVAYFTMELLQPAEPFDLAFRRALTAGDPACSASLVLQLVAGLEALHRAHKIHRDIKPSNVLVTADARVVLLDFGICSPLAPDGRHFTREAEIKGTPAYMGPEQLRGERLTRAADWFGVGTMIRLALEQVERDEARDVAALQPVLRVYRGLSQALCEALPEQRASGQAVRSALQRYTAEERERLPSLSDLLLGREEALRELEARTLAGKIVLLSGAPGLGKTALVRRFMREFEAAGQARGETCLMLSGRCRERERVPFKGLEEALMPLLLGDIPGLEISAEKLSRLRELFPDYVYERGPRLRSNNAPALRTLREVLQTGGRSGRRLLCLEDVQWAPGETLSVLGQLFAGSKVALSCVLTVRSEHRQRVLDALAREELTRCVDVLDLTPLAPSDAEALASRLIPELSSESWQALARASRGNPRRLRMLAEAREWTVTSYEEFLRKRLASLSEQELSLLVAASASASELPLAVASKLVGEKPCNVAVQVLCASGLLALEAQGLGLALVVSDPAVRDLALASCDEPQQIRLHRRLAEELSKLGAEAAILLHHYRESGQFDLAVASAERAGDEAAEGAGWTEALAYYAEAMELDPPSLETRSRIEQKIALCRSRALPPASTLSSDTRAHTPAEDGAHLGATDTGRDNP